MDDPVLSEWSSTGGLRVNVFLAWAIDGNLDSNLTTLDFFAVHFGHGFLLELFRGKGHEPEATALSRLIAGLELGNHETRDGTESDLCGRGFVGCEELLELQVGKSDLFRSLFGRLRTFSSPIS